MKKDSWDESNNSQIPRTRPLTGTEGVNANVFRNIKSNVCTRSKWPVKGKKELKRPCSIPGHLGEAM